MRLNLRRLALLTGRAARVIASRHGLTPQRYDLMHVVRRRALPQKTVAELLCVARSVVSRMVDALAQLGLVERTTPPYDRRQRLVGLTDAGRERLTEALRDGAQSEGERTWMRAWRKELARLGMRIDSVWRARSPHDHRALAAWNSRHGRMLEDWEAFCLLRTWLAAAV